MGNVMINAGLLPPVIKQETTFGVQPLDFVNHDGTVKGLPINQSFESPINVVDSYNKEVIKSTFGSQVQKDSVIILGERSVTANFGHQIGLNDFVVLGNMFFQNGYVYTPTITDNTILSITNDVDTVTIEVTDIGDLINDEEVIISGRADSLEDGTYVVANVNTNSFDITYVGGFDTGDLTGTIVATRGKHEMLIEDIAGCSQLLEKSFAFFLPEKFPDKDAVCGTSQGEIYSGVVPKMLDIDFIESTWNIDTIGKSLEDAGATSPRIDDDYEYPIGEDGYMRKNFGTLQKYNSVTGEFDNLETLSLTLGIEFGTADDEKVRSAGELTRAIVDGVDLIGQYETLYLTEDEQKNVSNSIYEKRNLLQSGGLYRLALENTSGEAIYIEGNIKFYGEELTREEKGWKLKADFQFLRNSTDPHVKLTCINRYNKDLSTLF